jgi:hypothetical protein
MVAPAKPKGGASNTVAFFNPDELEIIMPTSVPVKAPLRDQTSWSPPHLDLEYDGAFVLIIWAAIIVFLVIATATGRLPSTANGQTFPAAAGDNLDWTSI